MKNLSGLVLLICGISIGCAGTGSAGDEADDSFLSDSGRSDDYAIRDGGPEALAILEVANTADQEVLDREIGLDRRAAQGIVNTRTRSFIASLSDLDAVPYVGPQAFATLLEYVWSQGLVQAAPAACEWVSGDIALADQVLQPRKSDPASGWRLAIDTIDRAQLGTVPGDTFLCTWTQDANRYRCYLDVSPYWSYEEYALRSIFEVDATEIGRGGAFSMTSYPATEDGRYTVGYRVDAATPTTWTCR